MKLLPVYGVLVFTILLLYAVSDLPINHNPAVKNYYLQNSLEKTGSPNIVNAIVWDFRAYDTLGEETVLFTAVLAVFLIVHRKSEFKLKTLKKHIRKITVR
ncbi:MAG: hydrogen gas-evolving membrane-bound hydrogenase subunit E [archaeon]